MKSFLKNSITKFPIIFVLILASFLTFNNYSIAADEGEACSTTADCNSGGCAGENRCYCASGTCYFTFWGGYLCENAEQCVSRICRTAPDRSMRCGCRTIDDCGYEDPTAGRCESGWCVAAAGRYGNEPCSSGSECLSGECRSGTCTCSANEQCPNFRIGTEICQEGRCVATSSQRCTTNADCATGVCLTDRGTCGCRTDADCTGGGTCQDSLCVIATTTLTAPLEDVSKLKKISAAGVPELVGNILKKTLGLTGSIALLFFVYAGILWLTSGGNPDKIKKAQQIMVWAVIGIFVIFASYVIVSKVIETLGG